jgi:hypothetical protein
VKIRAKHEFLYRAVSDEELIDIEINGLRNKSGAYETGKLFALTLIDAARFGKNNFFLDDLCNTLIKVSVPIEIYISSVKFEADGMQAVLIEKECLNLLKVFTLNCSPIV